ncbi:hypothetical protein [uncultured Fructobacillus sp.]|uniref:hypothetical protein n=1 Tax=uncultured Fructobacillus sp. TaxID=591942 RepID=UPI0025929D94|nr:hypothetical protein [uncultured Fructobacillus sp.]
MTKEISVNLAKKIKEERSNKNLTLSQMVRKTDINRTKLKEFFINDRRVFSDDIYQKLWRFAYYDD